MRKNASKQKMVFRDYYEKLSLADKKSLRERIVSECNISIPSFYLKTRNNTYTVLELKCISQLLNINFA